MTISQNIAKHFKEIYFGGNWTVSDLKSQLTGVTWQQATQKIQNLNTLVALVFHIHYYVEIVNKVLAGESLQGSDKLSFNHPPINSESDWEEFLKSVFNEGEKFIQLVEQIPDAKLSETFFHEKYGSYYRNLHGVIEHAHYHLGQIALIKKLVQIS
jgi:hypothetical protein